MPTTIAIAHPSVTSRAEWLAQRGMPGCTGYTVVQKPPVIFPAT
jgi:hypothetical protein